MKLNNLTAVITGAGNGIGRASAERFAREGARVVVADINTEGSAETVRRIQASGGTALAIKVDVADAASVEALAKRTADTFGGADILFNNAAIQVNKWIEDTSTDEWSRQMSVNVGGVFHCVKFFLPQLIAARGSIVNMSSVNGYFAEPMCAGYCATKGAIIALTKAMAIDFGRYGVRVNCICPGYIDAGLAEGYFEAQADPAAARQAAGKLHALGRIGTGDEVARVAVFLAGPESSFMTGSAVSVDGGLGSGLPQA